MSRNKNEAQGISAIYAHIAQAFSADCSHVYYVDLNTDEYTAFNSGSGENKEVSEEHCEGWCLIALDLEHFRLFNEWYGRDAGDELLAQIGGRLARVETEEETEFIRELGCHYVQGYHFFKPMPVPAFETLIGDETRIDTSGFSL